MHEWHPGVGLPDLLSPSVQTTPVAVKAGAGPQEDPDPSSEWPVSRPISGTNVTTPLGLGLFVCFFNLFYLFLAALGLCCCVWGFSS